MKGSLFFNKTYSDEELSGLLESILFVHGKPVNHSELSETLELSKKKLDEMIAGMNERYTQRKSGLHIVQVAGGYQLVTHPQFREELSELFGTRNENQLSKSMLETLAIIAYKQPVSKEEVDNIRGVSSSRTMNSLLAYKLITVSGSTDGIVKSPVFSVTNRFLEMFHINSVDDLPSMDSIDWDEKFEDENDSQEDRNRKGEEPEEEGDLGLKEDS